MPCCLASVLTPKRNDIINEGYLVPAIFSVNISSSLKKYQHICGQAAARKLSGVAFLSMASFNDNLMLKKARNSALLSSTLQPGPRKHGSLWRELIMAWLLRQRGRGLLPHLLHLGRELKSLEAWHPMYLFLS